jgi:hypothetical protein
LALLHLQRRADGDAERAADLLCRALAAAERLGIPEAEQIRGILERNGLSC